MLPFLYSKYVLCIWMNLLATVIFTNTSNMDVQIFTVLMIQDYYITVLHVYTQPPNIQECNRSV